MILPVFIEYDIPGIINMSFYDEVLDRAIEVLGTQENAIDWLDKMSDTLQATPKKLCATREGANRVLRHLHSVELALGLD